MNGNENQGFTAYEYANVTMKRDEEPLYVDCYRSFGWEIAQGRDSSIIDPYVVSVKMKRDRKIKNRSEVNAQQRRCETALETIRKLDNQKTTNASIAAYVIGLLGTVFMALATFSFLWGNIPLCIIFAVPGFIGWGVSYLAYLRVKKSKAAKNSPLIDEQYDIVYDTCEQASALLA